MNTRKIALALTLLSALLLSACVVAPPGRGGAVVVAPALPVVVELGVEPFYFYGGFHYYYDNSRWSYSRSRSGPWVELPRSHYPRETRLRGRDDRRDDDRGRRDRDDRDDRRRDRDRDGRR